MFSFNQQGATSTNLDMFGNNVHTEQWTNDQSHWATGTNTTNAYHQNQQWQSWQPSGSTESQNWLRQSAANYYQSFSSSVTSNQAIHTPVYQNQMFRPVQGQNLHNQSTPKCHQAQITLVPNPNVAGSFKAVVKRKRKRTMFTTEQIEKLESVFKKKPYVTREDRQVLVEQLQVSDTSVKVWFQNRRLRRKREMEEAAQEAAERSFYDTNSSDESLYSSTNEKSPAEVNARIDLIESELSKKTDENGYVTLDHEAIGQIVNIIDATLSSDVDLTTPSSTSADIEDSDDSEESYAESIYEPISPAMSDATDQETLSWKPFAPEQSLQRLFDLHFC